jgi:hypothetical protein
MAPNGDEDLEAQVPQSFEPGSFRQDSHEFGWGIFVPPAHPSEFVPISATKESGKHEGNDFAQKLLLRPQTAFDLRH